MTVQYHPAVQGDLNEALAHYAEAGGPHLAIRFETDFRNCVAAIKAAPTAFAHYHQSPVFRRVRLKHFPFIILYREIPAGLRVTLLKHERRHPLHGLERR